MLSHIILSVALLAPAQCPGGTCQAAPAVAPVHSVLKRVASVDAQPVRKTVKVVRQRLVRRWRLWR